MKLKLRSLPRKRNPIAASLAVNRGLKLQIVPARKGKGAYRRMAVRSFGDSISIRLFARLIGMLFPARLAQPGRARG
ncbi:MAG TPA: hypothetical protein VN809_09480 [Telmatospirillum sp.]|nr:hypothetical protein [Telmatospirillum sp.]